MNRRENVIFYVVAYKPCSKLISLFNHRRPKLKIRVRNMTIATRRVVLQGSRLIDLIWQIHFRHHNAKIKLRMGR